MSFFSDLFSNSNAQGAANSQIDALNQGYHDASKLFGQGRDALNTNYAEGLKPFTELYGRSGAGLDAYGNALGLNGAAGSAQATNAFRATPGYQFALDQGLKAVDRGAASHGMLSSGNTIGAEQTFGTGLADQTYQNYVKNLQPYFGLGTASAGGIGTVDTGLGNALNTSYGNQGNLKFQTDVGIGNANASAQLAQGAASQNIFGGIMGGLSLGSKLLGFL